MSKKRIQLLAVIMGITLAALIIIQTQYFISAAEIRKEQFNHAVNKAIDKVIFRLEEKEGVINIRESLGIISTKINKTKLVPEANKDYVDIDQKVRFYLGNSKHVNPTYRTQFNVFQKDSLVYSVNDCNLKHKNHNNLSINTRKLQEELRNKFISKNYTLRQMASQITYSRRNISEKISEVDIKSLIKEQLNEYGVFNHYEFAIKEGDRYLQISNNYINQKTEYRYKKRLFPNDVIPGNGTIHVIFPNRSEILASSFLMLFPSIFTAILLLLTCTFTIYIIFKQKKISTIKNDFINNMTHELKTPISTISLASQMLKDDSVNNSEVMVNSIANIITEESSRLTNQIEKVLQMAVFTESRLKLKQKKININSLIAELSSRFSLKVEDKNGSISIDLSAKDDLVYVDEVHISNVITNLLDNAVKYCETEPNIKIITKNRNDWFIIYVHDNAIGISKKEQKLIFERFYRVSTGNIHDVKGFGLGLSYVKKIIEQQGGTVSVESAIGKGSTFKIFLPLNKIKDK
ncbi:MAG: HAMP domain-containing sensor histidine kinase [Marinifilaceae bacterium]